MSWWLAKEHCKKNGGKLVEIDLEEENRALVEEIKRNRFTERHMNFWIGLTDLRKEGDWRLASDASQPSYLNWDSDNRQPNNGNDPNEDCARLRMGRPEWKDKWSDLECGIDRFKNSKYPATCHDNFARPL